MRAGSVQLARGAVVEARYESRLGLRVGGWVLGLGGISLGLGLMLSDTDNLGGSFWAGCTVGALGVLVGAILGAMPDAAHFHVVH